MSEPFDATIYGKLEAVLFAMGEPVALTTLASALELPAGQIETALRHLAEEYEREDRGLALVWVEDSVQLTSNPRYNEALSRVVNVPDKQPLSTALLETLAVIAYDQPVTKAQVSEVRGTNSEHAIARLVEYDLVTDVGRLETAGRPLLYGTTEQFLKCFGIGSVRELPEATADTAMINEQISLDNLPVDRLSQSVRDAVSRMAAQSSVKVVNDKDNLGEAT